MVELDIQILAAMTRKKRICSRRMGHSDLPSSCASFSLARKYGLTKRLKEGGVPGASCGNGDGAEVNIEEGAGGQVLANFVLLRPRGEVGGVLGGGGRDVGGRR